MDEKLSNKRVLIAAGLIALGVMSLMNMGALWPIFVMGPGLFMLIPAMIGSRTWAAAFSIPGMFLTGLGALFFVQAWTGYWNSWAYAWTLLPAFVGAGFALMGVRLNEQTLVKVGDWFVYGSLIAFAGFAILFEVIIGISGGIGSLGALLLIGLGFMMLSKGGPVNCAMSKFMGDRVDMGKTKRKPKTKRGEEFLFTGPVVYGSRVSARRLVADEVPADD